MQGAHLWKSIDGGKIWQESDEGFPHDEETSIHDLVLDSQNSNVIYAAATRHESRKAIGIYKSTYAGKTCTPSREGLFSQTIPFFSTIFGGKTT